MKVDFKFPEKAIALFGAILPCVYILGYTGFSLETNWTLLWLCLPLALMFVRVRPTPAHWIGAAFLTWSAVTTLWAPAPWATEAALKLGAAACAFLIGAEVEDDEWLFKGLAVGLGINSAVAIAQTFGYATGITGGTSAGLLYNSNALTEPAALVAFVLALDGRIWWALPSVPAILLPHTRAGLAVLVVGFLAWVLRKSKLGAMVLAAVACAIAAQSLDKGWRAPSTEQRAAIWQDTLAGLTPLGHGLGSFGRDYPRYATRIDTTRERPYHAHSDILEVTFELGIPGFLLFVAFFGTCWFLAQPRERILLTPCIALVTFDFPLYVPTTGFIIAFLAGRAASGWHERSVVGVERGYGFVPSDEVRRSLRTHQGKHQVSI